ncbi:proteoglycan 4-like [Alligator mississippiensis]|uniref:Proteoglycan 4-like n=1 Tax=Alligator mississippiensis TaxID=8496 RepID=A0A151NTH7_ALLMI|nr:proteoglycan 4-like [Alligator mississippiensis]
MDELDRNVRQKHLTFLCGLSQHYLKPWAAATPAAMAFQGTEAPFLAAAQREVLEQHVLRRRLQHNWGLPGTVQRSLCAFLPLAPAHPELPRLPALGLDVQPLMHDLPFLSKQVQSDLEAHVRQLVLQQKWVIPKKVGRSVWRFVASMPHTRESIISATGMPGPAVGHEDHGAAEEWLQEMMPEAPAALLLHSAPAASWGLSQYGPVQLSPAQDSEKSERTMHKMKLVPIRLGRTPAAMATALGMVGGLQGGAARECLEAHISKKKLQHAWGLPALVQRSLGAFAAPPPSSTPRPQQELPALVGVSMAMGKPRFLSTKAWQHLEAHVQRQVAERRWGLPRRVQESLRRLQLPGSAESRVPTEPQLCFGCEKAPETPALDRGQRGLLPSGSREPPAQHWHELQISCCCEMGSLQPAEEPEGTGSSGSSQETSQPSSGEEPPGPPSGSCQTQEPRTWQGEQQSCHDSALAGGSSGKGGSGGSCACPEGCNREWVSVELDSSLRKRAEEHSQGATCWLDTHLAQQAPGSFLLLPDITRCQGLCTEMAAECARDTAHEGWDQLHGGEARKSEPSGHWHTASPNALGPPGQTASCMSGCRQEPWAVGLVQETLTREPRSLACNGVHVTRCSLSATREDIPAGSSLPAHSEGVPGTEKVCSESQGDEKMPGYGEEPNASPPPSEFSTECEWERVGDWDREEMDAWGLKGKAGPAGVGLSPASVESNAEGTLELADAPSRDPRFEQMTVIGLILEKRLHLRHGLYYWQQSRDRRSAVWAQAAEGGAAGIVQQ